MEICLAIKTSQTVISVVGEIIYLNRDSVSEGAIVSTDAMALFYMNIIFGAVSATYNLLMFFMGEASFSTRRRNAGGQEGAPGCRPPRRHKTRKSEAESGTAAISGKAPSLSWLTFTAAPTVTPAPMGTEGSFQCHRRREQAQALHHQSPARHCHR